LARRSRSGFWLSGLVLLVLTVWLGTRWLVATLYPLDPYRELIFARSRQHGLDPYLVAAVIRQESKFNPGATSYQGARGLMQVLPDTGRWVADQMGLPFVPEMLYDPDYNILIGCWYLAHQRSHFGGDIVLALAAYNSGRGNVERWLREARWTGEKSTMEQIPFPETRHYVRQVMQSYERYRRIYTP
jgi:soluble lytic murein transglycosylase